MHSYFSEAYRVAHSAQVLSSLEADRTSSDMPDSIDNNMRTAPGSNTRLIPRRPVSMRRRTMIAVA
jgi:hypothetical protein